MSPVLLKGDRVPLRLWADPAGLEQKARHQLGTLGRGNHFIELCLDEEGRVWVMLHSGSRNIGKEVADAHIRAAKRLDHNRGLPDPNLAVFLQGTQGFDRYWHDLTWAQAYAAENRAAMLDLLTGVLDEIPGAYKDIDAVMERQKDLVAPLHTLKQLLCVKG